MGHSQAEKAKSRERILDAAARQIRQGGLDSVSIAELMKEANLTHGGFYGHFPSRAALIAAALDRALNRGEAAFAATTPVDAGEAVKSFVNDYLSPAHRDDAGEGCAIGALSGDVGRIQDEALRARMVKQVELSFEYMTKAIGDGPDAEDASVAVWCAMLGAINLSRVFRGTDRSEQILRLARQLILDLEARAQDAERSERRPDVSTPGG